MAQAPQLNDSQLNLLAKIAANTGETQPKHGDGQHNLLYKIAQNTYASSGLAGSALQSSGDGYVLCQQGDNLAAKYAEAKAKSPSATNRVTLFIVPGTYSLSSELAIDAEYVDIVGLGAQFQSPAVIVTNNTLNVTANDVRVSGISVGAQQFKITDNKPLQVFEDCSGGNNSFGGGGTASGTFVGCVGGDDSFGGYDITQSSTSTFNGCIAGSDGFGGNADEYPSGKYISCRVTTGAFPTIYIPGKARFCLDDDYNIVNADGGYDSDVESFITTAGVTDDTAKDQLNLFVIGIKRLGLWNNMVCWPLRSAQNAGTGSTAYSLGGLGTYNGTLVNGPTWGADGVNFADNTTQHISTALTQTSADAFSAFACVQCNTEGVSANVIAATRNTSTGRTGFSMAQSWVGQGAGAIVWNTPDSVILEAAITDGSYQCYLVGGNFINSLAASSLSRNGAAKSFGTAQTLARSGSPISLILGNDGATAMRSLGSNMPFFAYFADYSVNSSFIYSLYKSTLGQGLALP